MSQIDIYVSALDEKFRTGDATEHTHRGALETYIDSLADDLMVINERRRLDVGAPDLEVRQGQGATALSIGIVECKDIGVNLDKVEKGEQLARYHALENVILTDYLEFRWYIKGDKQEIVRIAEVDGKRVKPFADNYPALATLFNRFLQYQIAPVHNARELAERLAGIAQLIRDFIRADLQGKTPEADLVSRMEAFKQTLLPEITPVEFADMYAQTVTYGMFAARMNFTGHQFTRYDAARYIPQTNPFLRKLFHNMSFDVGEKVNWVLDRLATLLALTDTDEVMKDFGKATRQQDPIVHFYETFLSEYDPSVREKRGVYYTPEPVVSYIVRSVDHILRDTFGRVDGLGDKNTLILDPATGTGTFLYFVIQHIYEQFTHKQQWQGYAQQHLLKRIFGFELLMAPYTVAHMKLGLQLQQLGYQFTDDQRLGIYLTNTLEEGVKREDAMFAQYIADEANAAAAIKRDKPIMVVLGNPPYSKFSANTGNWINDLVRDYYFIDGQPLGERNPKWLQDDYVKFIRFGQWRIDETASGILAFVTNHGYLDNPTFRGMRKLLLDTFDEIYLLDIHGNARRTNTSPDGSPDENVFDIQQGVAIGLFVKHPDSDRATKVFHLDIWGNRQSKHSWLFENDISDTEWEEIFPQSPFYLFVPQNVELLPEYNQFWLVTEVFGTFGSTVTTARNHFSLDFDEPTLVAKAQEFADSNISNQAIREKYSLRDVSYWKLEDARNEIYEVEDVDQFVKPYCYRPFDFRFVFYHHAVCERPRYNVMSHMRETNLAFLTHRPQSPGNFTFAYCTTLIGDQNVAANKSAGGGNSYQFPLYLYPEKRTGELFALEDDGSAWQLSAKGRRPNLNPDFVKALEAKLGLTFITEGRGKSPLRSGGDLGGEKASPSPLRVDTADRPLPDAQGGGIVYTRTTAAIWERLKPFARHMRKEPTAAEDALWQRLRKKQLGGVRIRRQHPIQQFIADFYCPSAKLVIEVDGSIHELPDQQAYDELRQEFLESLGLRVLRFDNDAVLNDIEGVLAQIEAAITMTDDDPQGTFGPEDIFNYAYAVFHSPTYRERYAEFLKIDFPRLPLTSDVALFFALSQLGAELVQWHLMTHPQLQSDINLPPYPFPIEGDNIVAPRHPRYEETQQRVYINGTQYFENITPELWEFHIGGYQVLDKWLKDRKGRELTYDPDQVHYMRIVLALKETMRLMDAIDDAMPSFPLT